MGTAEEIFQHAGKHDSQRQRLKGLDKIEENSGTQFFKTITGIKSDPEAFVISRSKKITLTNLGVTDTLLTVVSVRSGITGGSISAHSMVEL